MASVKLNVMKTALLLCITTFSVVHSLRHTLDIRDDSRKVIKVESFGFFDGGQMDMSVKRFKSTGEAPFKLGFIMRKTTSESAAQQDIEEQTESGNCLLDSATEDDFVLDLSNPSSWSGLDKSHLVGAEQEGLYSLIFVRCSPDSASVTFKLNFQFYNPGPNYLTAGDAPLPHLLFAFFAFFLVAFVAWIVLMRKNLEQVHHIHHMMSVLLIFKCMTLLFESIRLHYIKVTGHAETWSVVYFIFAFVKGVMLFVVILLIGTGWSLVKPYLNDREKRIIVVVLTLQVIDNIAMVILEETTPGTQRWLNWRDILHLVDIVCCCAVLFPIVWSIKHLRQAAGTDGKAGAMLSKLSLFRGFYIMVVTYIYFTRIVIFLLAATLSFKLLWLRTLFTELATLIFFTYTGYKFRPQAQNPYLPVDKGDPNLEEFGLDESEADDEVEMTVQTTSAV